MNRSVSARERCPTGLCPLTRETDIALFSGPAIAVATYSGTPLAGFLLIAANYWRFHARRQAAAAAMLGLMVTALAVLCWVTLPYAVSAPSCLVLLLATRLIAARLQGGAVAMHVSRGGRLASKRKALGVGIVCLAALLVGLRILVSLI